MNDIDPVSAMRSDVEHMARATNQPPHEAALGLAALIECGLVLVEGEAAMLAVDRLRALAATYM